MTNNELHAMVKELKEYKLLKEETEARIAELEAIVKAEMHLQDKNKMTVGEYKLSLTTVTSSRVDSKALKEQQPDIYNAFVKPSTYERFTIR